MKKATKQTKSPKEIKKYNFVFPDFPLFVIQQQVTMKNGTESKATNIIIMTAARV